MKVKDLVASLQKLDPNLDVYAYCEDEFMDSSKPGFAFYMVDSVDQTRAVLSRDDARKPQVTFGDDKHAQSIAIVSFIADY